MLVSVNPPRSMKPSRQFVDEQNADGDAEDGEEAIERVRDDRGISGEAGIGEQLGAVVHHRVDAGQLLGDAEPYSDDHQPEHPLRCEIRQTAGLGLLFLLGEDLDLLHLGFGAFVGTNLLEDVECLILAVLCDQPARALGQEDHPHEQRDGRKHRNGEHIAPDPVMLAPDVEDDRVDDEGGELTDDDHHLIAGHQRTAFLERCEFGQIDGHRRRGRADRQAQEEAGTGEELPVRCKRTRESPDDEERRQEDDVRSPAEGVGEAPADHRAEGGADGEEADDQTLGVRRQAEVVRQRFEGTVDDPCVVAEQQTAESGDDGDDAQA